MTDRPNILVLMADQHAFNVAGPYGHAIVRTPRLDRLAAEGTTFENAYTNCPICVPSRMSFMTGLYAQRLGVWDNGVPLREDQPTWAHLLRNAGYHVALSGKMHFRGHDQLHGFEQQLAIDINAQNRPVPVNWLAPQRLAKPRHDMPRGAGDTKELRADRQAADAAVRYLNEPERKQQPWALAVGFVAPHNPFVAPQEYYDLYEGVDIPLPDSPNEPERLHPAMLRMHGARNYQLADDVIRDIRRSYYALTSFLDAQVGRVLAALDATGQADNTVVIYTADHGEMLGEHGMWNKSCFFEQSSHIPLIIRAAGGTPGARIRQVVSLVDVARTIIDLAGPGPEEPSSLPHDGASLLPLVHGDVRADEGQAFAEYSANYSTAPMAMLRRGRMKLNCYHGEVPELFDLDADPAERQNLAGDPAYAEIQADLTTRLQALWDAPAIQRRVLASQTERRSIAPYLFDYLNR